MTRKDFQLIADAIKEARTMFPDTVSGDGARLGADAVAVELASRLRATNTRFDREKFLAACGVKL